MLPPGKVKAVGSRTTKDQEQPQAEAGLAEQVAGQIRGWILDGTYQPGDKLPAERQLATMLGVNRTSLRLALKRLKQLGLLESRVGDGTRVRELTYSAGIELLPYMFRNAMSTEPDVLRDMLELRDVVCCYLVRMAARRSDEVDMERVNAAIDKMEQARGDPALLGQLAYAVYWEYARAGQSMIGQLLLNTIRSTFERHTEMFAAMSVDPRLAIASQRALAEAVAAGDPEEASRVANEQLRRGTKKALAAFDLEPIDGAD